MRQCGSAAFGFCIVHSEAYLSILNYYILQYIIIIYNIIVLGAAEYDFVMPRCRTAALPRPDFNISNKSKIKLEKPLFASIFLVPLHCQNREAPRSVWAAGAQRLGTLYGKAREPMRKGSAAWADALGCTQRAAPERRQT